ncbi:hypothetical protein NM688_g820 [Phlebia brevispora]|uniref:Uncharacterized protein n=1 Tax=Phlebia brevispora TaxID=194682 RepID=A0ACC1TD07_9APHY|nr:hypothetical protein NM688_g820 [Phlebia brevispora]
MFCPFGDVACVPVFVTLVAALLCASYLLSRTKFLKPGPRRLPCFRGPRGLPLLGNILQIHENQWLQYASPIFSLNFAGQHVLVVGSARVAAELMDRRSSIYSDRPRFIMAAEILTGGMNLAFARWGDRWKRMRKAANTALSAAAAARYTTLQEKEARCFLQVIYAYPPLPRPASSSQETDINEASTLIKNVEDYVSRMLKAALPGNYLVEFFPWMMYIPAWFPGAAWKRQGRMWFRRDTNMFLDLVAETKAAIKDGTRGKCFVAELLNSSAQHDLDPVETAWLAGMMFGAGAEALAATFAFFVLAMVLFPHVQEKLRTEIDSVVGDPDDKASLPRIPTFHDTQKMPYLHAVIKEVMRWRPMGPMGIPHRSVEDDVYEGHFIPAGTLIVPNVWTMHHDECVYPDAQTFKPERFLAEDGVTPVAYRDTKELGHHTFGFGRRACPGYHVANNVLAINGANLVWAFRISKAVDHHGREITPDPDALLDEGPAVRPMPFDCVLKVRSTMVKKMLSEESGL